MLVEKPIAATTADGSALVEAAERRGVPLLVGQHRRHSAFVQRAREVIGRGELGRLVSFTALWFVRKPDDYYAVGWRTRPGGGPVLTNLIHEIDLIRHLGGEIERVYAASSSAARGLAVEDSVAITLRLAGGALGSIAASDAVVSPWSYELTTHENPLYTRTDRNCYFLLGTSGSLAFPRLTLWRHPGETGWQHPLSPAAGGRDRPRRRPARPPARCRDDPAPAGGDAVDPVAAQLAGALLRGDPRRRAEPTVSGPDGLATLAATEAVLQSAREDRPPSGRRALTTFHHSRQRAHHEWVAQPAWFGREAASVCCGEVVTCSIARSPIFLPSSGLRRGIESSSRVT